MVRDFAITNQKESSPRDPLQLSSRTLAKTVMIIVMNSGYCCDLSLIMGERGEGNKTNNREVLF